MNRSQFAQVVADAYSSQYASMDIRRMCEQLTAAVIGAPEVNP
jgi:hypothetical protein